MARMVHFNDRSLRPALALCLVLACSFARDVRAQPAPAGGGTGRCPAGFLLVPAGEAVVGEPDLKDNPRRKVQVAAVCLQRTEVTAGEYGACVAAGKCVASAKSSRWKGGTDEEIRFASQFCNGGRAGREKFPINCVDFSQAESYCRFAGGRLPTETEWEYGARGGDGRSFPWGSQAPGPTLLNACGSECRAMAAKEQRMWSVMYEGNDGWPDTAPVGSFPAGASPFGLLDMAGNVWEWTSSLYRAHTTVRVARGGGWILDDARYARAAARFRFEPTTRGNRLGFRCAADPTP
jgi:formylglycine-generating enzyme required for sulfatase activity